MAGMLSADELTAELTAHGLNFLVDAEPPRAIPRLFPAELLAALAQETDARLRVALIALLLAQPSLGDAAPAALALLAGDARSTLMLYYTAAATLQEMYAARLRPLTPDWRPLPDLFSATLGLPAEGDADTRLHQIGRLHRQVTGLAANWVGTYEYAAQRVLRRREKEALWAALPSMSLFLSLLGLSYAIRLLADSI